MFILTLPHPRALVTGVYVDTYDLERTLGVELWYLWLYLFEELNVIRPQPGGLDRFISSIELDMQIASIMESDYEHRRYIDNYEVINECLNYLYAHMRQTLINIMSQCPVIRTYNPEWIHIGSVCSDSLILYLFDNEVERDDWCRKSNETKIVLDNNRRRISSPGSFI